MYLEVDDLTKKTKPSSATYTIIAGGNMLTSAGTFYRIGNTTDWKFCIASPTKEEIENYERMKSPDMKAVDFASLPKESIDSSTVVAKGTASETPQSIDFANESGISLKVWLEPVKQTGSTE
ncbi:uncharacterized protein I206_107281 [Kwoniella pini CBS 10737]|uniref:Uncharacterized protein n=1 Tax=Kwoniella pini CBS 10737 TaxID=1296096 RepID=A0A1B9HYP6_9TREE|nr:uncharacterized protein I206_05174 [Kwoniella pini CBS 10737]OCF48397.1 hypothetical protein I206_05174 [Kwoniella pini CBS 10737]